MKPSWSSGIELITEVEVWCGNSYVTSLSISESLKNLISKLFKEVACRTGSRSPNLSRRRAVLTGVTTWGSDGPAIRSKPDNLEAPTECCNAVLDGYL
ncbi:hypothetical protein PoB_005782300 [Plakobranchus ocellatus]|uniref:Uncharacterized protein n=1 Tax=Plakobranchus ocellatus TaxID=259542 RepID=A0AAV4CJP6_9GAST|nr:hypothetical protein PoB_005782300 [Plakobranchus ocellatus]